MRKSIRSALVVAAVTLSLLVLPTAHPASADAPMATTTWPSNVAVGNVLAHGNSNYTAISQECPGYKNSTDTTAISAITYDGGVANSIKKLGGDYQTQACVDWMVAGPDSTSYAVQVASSSSYNYRLVAARDNMLLWTKEFTDSTCSGKAYIKTPRLGADGNLYALLFFTSCSKEALVSIDAASGRELWRTGYLPFGDANSISTATGYVFVHENGVAVRSGINIYFYDYNGTALTSSTFSPPSFSNTTMPFVSIVQSTGRTYLMTDRYIASTNSYERHLYYKDMASSTISEITLPSGTFMNEPFATPDNGVVLQTGYTNSSPGFNYYDASGSLVYSKNLASGETGMSYAGDSFGLTVDNLGNVITRRAFYMSSGTQDKNILIDEFSPTGVKTRLFNSSSLGGTGFDSFTSLAQFRQNIGGGKLYFVLCRRTDTYGASCNSLYSPTIVQLTVSATSDYVRYAAFSSQVGGTNRDYVALGDSFSSGEGIPAASAPYFIPPSDSNNCDRSFQAYPLKLQAASTGLRLRAFRACSGATTLDVTQGSNGETGQLDSIRPDTDVVTVTIGGNNVDFESFATACSTTGCAVDSLPYNTIMAAINDPGFSLALVDLYDRIRQHATNPNAKIYVVGYPRLAAAPYPSCGLLGADDQQAAELVSYALNNKISDAVDQAKLLYPGFTGFEYVSATANGSPFLGHELCTADSYFNGPNFWEHRFSFHPNAAGQQAYADLIAQYL